MIIGNNSNNPNNLNRKTSGTGMGNPTRPIVNNNFNRPMPQMEHNKAYDNTMLTKEFKNITNSNPTDSGSMTDRSLALLRERLKNNEITIEEFNQKCNLINKSRM